VSVIAAVKERLTRVSRVVSGLVVLFAFAHFAHHLVTALPVPLLPFIRSEFDLDYTKAALVVSAFSVPYGFSQLPGGWLADRFGARRLILIGISGVALAGLVVGLSTSYTMLLVVLFVMGALGGGYHPSAPAAIAQVTEPRHRGRALGFHMIGGSASFFLAPLAAGAIAAVWGWRAPFIALAVPAIGYGVVFYVLLGRRQRAARELSPCAPAARAASGPDTPDKIDWTRMVTFLILASVSSAFVLAVIAFIPLYIVDVHGYAERDGAAAVALFYSTGLWAAVAGGYLSDRIGRVRVVVLFGILAGPALAVLDLSGSMVALMALVLFLGAGHYVRSPAAEAYIVGHTPVGKHSTVLGVYFFGSIEASGVLAPAVGFLIDRYGFHTSFLLSGIGLLLITVVCAAILLPGSRGD
jgi:MFS family permease